MAERGDDWNFTPPPESGMGDREVRPQGRHLDGRRVALMITGGIAAYKAPGLARALRRQGAEVVAFVTDQGLRYVTADTLEWSTLNPVVTRLSAEAEHLSDAAPFDAYLVAPATYNTLNKMAAGIADTPVTSTLASALGRMERGETRVLVVPTMHGSLHNSLLTDSLHRLHRMGVRVVPPRRDYGKHNIPSDENMVAEVCRQVSTSPLRDRRVLVTGGPTPVPIDSVRRISNRFRGTLGAEVALDLHLRGAEARFVLGDSGLRPGDPLAYRLVRTYDEYTEAVLDELSRGAEAAVFTAAVADYRPKEVREGKTPSGGALSTLELEPTAKVVETVRERFPDLYMVTFKYEEGVSHEELMEVGRRRLARLGGRGAVVANRGEESGAGGEQVAWLLTHDAEPRRMQGKPAIAAALADHLEETLPEGDGDGAD